MDDRSLDEMRRRIQEALARSKREQLREEFGRLDELSDAELAAEAEREARNYILEFDRQFKNAERISVRERIGDPPLPSLDEIPAYVVEEAVENLLHLLAEHGIVVDFLGDWDEPGAYRYITEELLDLEMDDMRIDGLFIHFQAATPEYEVQMWIDGFVHDLFWQERDYHLSGLEKQPLFDTDGEPLDYTEFTQKLEAVWERLSPVARVELRPSAIQVMEEEAFVTAVVSWNMADEEQQVESAFRLQASPYGGWDVVQTSLLDDLLSLSG